LSGLRWTNPVSSKWRLRALRYDSEHGANKMAIAVSRQDQALDAPHPEVHNQGQMAIRRKPHLVATIEPGKFDKHFANAGYASVKI
jgi:hypothetical protein